MLDYLQFSVVYYLYKTRYYKTGRGYVYRANQLMSVGIALVLITVCRLGFTNGKPNAFLDFAIFVVAVVPSFIYFERNVSKRKMLKYRRIYPSAGMTFTVFASVVGVLLFFLVITSKYRAS
jgi:hypothetical protein